MEQHQQQQLLQQHPETTVVGEEDGSDAMSLKNEQAEVS